MSTDDPTTSDDDFDAEEAWDNLVADLLRWRPDARQMALRYSGRVLVSTHEAEVRWTEGAKVARPQPLPPNPYTRNQYAWGYSGTGPHHLALDILLHYLGEQPDPALIRAGVPLAWKLHWDFTDDFTSQWDWQEHPSSDPAGSRHWALRGSVIGRWIVGWLQIEREQLDEHADAVVSERLRQIAAKAEADQLGQE